MDYVRKAWQFVSRLVGPAKVWATNNIGKIIEWIKTGYSPEWIINRINKILGN